MKYKENATQTQYLNSLKKKNGGMANVIKCLFALRDSDW